MKIRTRIYLLIVVSFLLVAGCAAFIYFNWNETRILAREFEYSFIVTEEARELRALTYDYLLSPAKETEKKWFSELFSRALTASLTAGKIHYVDISV